MPNYLTRKQVASHYPISFSTLAHMASQGRGPKYRIIGKSAVYRADEVESWLDAQVITFAPSGGGRGRPRKFAARQIK